MNILLPVQLKTPARWRKADKSLRLISIASCLGCLWMMGYVTKDDSNRRQLGEADPFPLDEFSCEQPFYSSFCGGNCTNPDGYTFACCKSDDTCMTLDGEMCEQSWLFVSHLVPGGNGAAECLADWEKGVGGALVYIIILLYLFLGLAIVCDDYFVASLEKISDGLNLSADVAGATFMAAGSSAPEFFVSLADNVFADPPKSVGVGTIIGSAIFNILMIIGLSAIMAGEVLHLNWRPLARDVSFYVISICALTAVVFDGAVQWWEGLILLSLYFLYIAFMTINGKFFIWVDDKLGIESEKKEPSMEEDAPEVIEETKVSIDGAEEHDVSIVIARPQVRHTVETSRPSSAVETAAELEINRLERHGSDSMVLESPLKEQDETHLFGSNPLRRSKNRAGWGVGTSFRNSARLSARGSQLLSSAALRASQNFNNETTSSTESDSDTEKAVVVPKEVEEEISTDYWEPLRWPVAESPSSCCGNWKEMWKARVWYCLCYPFNVLFRFSVPDCNFDIFREDKDGEIENRKLGYWTCFLLCIVWIALLSHFLVFAGAKFGYIVGLSPAAMGLTILAAGTSVPDAISSIIVARQGEGDMAVANSIGSNVFDILMGLGFPWMIAPWVYGKSTVVMVDDLWIGIGFLFGVVVVLVAALVIRKMQLGRGLGWFFMFLYVLYIIFELAIHPTL